jgi:hypothetical protein
MWDSSRQGRLNLRSSRHFNRASGTNSFVPKDPPLKRRAILRSASGTLFLRRPCHFPNLVQISNVNRDRNIGRVSIIQEM